MCDTSLHEAHNLSPTKLCRTITLYAQQSSTYMIRYMTLTAKRWHLVQSRSRNAPVHASINTRTWTKTKIANNCKNYPTGSFRKSESTIRNTTWSATTSCRGHLKILLKMAKITYAPPRHAQTYVSVSKPKRNRRTLKT